MNENVADASENAEIAINQLVANNYTVISILSRVRKKHLLDHFVKPDDVFNELDEIFEKLEILEKEGLFKYLQTIYQ